MKTGSNYSKLAFFIIALIILHPSLITLCTAQTPVFYGMTYNGGIDSFGTIFTFNPTNDSEKVVWNFGSGTDGQSPGGNLVYDSINGLFYGMTTNGGGGNNGGVIFSFNPVNDSENVLWDFGNDGDGLNPNGNLVYNAANGLFYGMTYRGGTVNEGVIFSFNPVTDSEKVLWNFGNMPDAQHPTGDLVYNAANGLYYGTTEDGGTAGYGAIISFNTATDSEKVLSNLSPVGFGGWGPGGNLTYDATTGLYYTMTQYGGSNGTAGDNSGDGSIISFSTVTDSAKVVWSFGGAGDGKNPDRGLVYDSSTALFYGLTDLGGGNEDGAIISFDPVLDSEKVVWSFESEGDGQHPGGTLVYNAGNGLYYGMTAYGGNNGRGAIISFDPTTGKDSLLWSFGSGNDGANPGEDLVLYTPKVAGISSIIAETNITIYPNPTNGELVISGLSKGQIVVLYNALSQKVSSLITDGTTQQLNISAMANGMYVVRVFNGDGTPVDQKKVVKVN